ncbi:MAG: CCA tRNA nucleotidyltransferase [Pirellulales bacterium]
MANQLDPAEQQVFAVEVVRQLREAGFDAVWAGGCVRDRILGLAPKDFDVATSATPDQVRTVFSRRKTLALGVSFGVITVLGPKRAGQIEVATFRRDIGASDGRHPDQVAFTGPEEDARRRDFTINGLFYDPLEDRVIDYVGGRDDLASGVVRAIGDAKLRFAEDKLRMLRAVRFAATFGFALDEATLAAIEQMADQVSVVSAERIAQELRRMLLLARRVEAVDLLDRSRLFAVLFPNIAARRAEGGAEKWSATRIALGALDGPSFPVALAALFLGWLDGGEVQQVCRGLRLSTDEINQTAWLVQYAPLVDEAHRAPWPLVQRVLCSPGAGELVALAEARAKAGLAGMEGVNFCREKLALPIDQWNPPPLVTGDDLLARGVPEGKIYRVVLDKVRDAQLLGQVSTRDDALALVDRLASCD